MSNVQLLRLFSCSHYEDVWSGSFVVVEVVVSELRRTFTPCKKQVATVYRETETLSFQVMQTNEPAQLSNVNVEETS